MLSSISSSRTIRRISRTALRPFSSSPQVLKKTSKKFYAVRRGRDTGIFGSWDEAKQLVDGYPNAEFMAFGQQLAAQAWLDREETSGPRSSPERLVVYIDGGFRNGRAGIGVHWGGEPTMQDISERVPGKRQDSSVAELYALLRTLENDPDASRPMSIYLDSEYVLKTFTTYLPMWRKAGKTSYENKELVDRIDRLLKQRSVACKFVKANAHSRDFGNEQADRLATAAIALPDASRS